MTAQQFKDLKPGDRFRIMCNPDPTGEYLTPDRWDEGFIQDIRANAGRTFTVKGQSANGLNFIEVEEADIFEHHNWSFQPTDTCILEMIHTEHFEEDLFHV